jgi:signal peptide peptidase SppA
MYAHVIMACAGEVWALERGKLESVVAFLAFKARGGQFSEEDIQARIAPPPTSPSQPADARGAIAILRVYGVLAQRLNVVTKISGGTSMEVLAADLRAALSDTATKAIVLDFDSPGGTVSGTAELGQEIYDSRGVKPIIAQVNSQAASAAYWLACQCDEIVVTPGGRAGSIGVYTIHEDISKMLEKEGVATTMISAGKYKTEGNPYGPLGEEAAATIQARVDQSYTAFVQAVARGRRVRVAAVNDRFGQGRMFGAEELVARGMADRVATLPQTLERFGVSVHPVATANSSSREFRAMRQSLASITQSLKVR